MRGALPRVSSAWLFLLCVVALFYVSEGSMTENLFCGNRNCYYVLGVEQTATSQEIKKAFRQISLKYHPDKNKDPKAVGIFREAAQAYEILNSESRREAYDYFLENPHSYLASLYGVAAAYTDAQIGFHWVILGTLLFLSGIQWINQGWHYTHVRTNIKKAPKFKQVVDQQWNEKYSAAEQKKMKKDKTTEQKYAELAEEILEARCELPDPPSVSSLLIVRAFRSPLTLFEAVSWHVKFKVMKKPFGPAEKEYLTKKRMGMSEWRWKRLTDEERYMHMGKELWDDGKYGHWLKEEAEKNDIKSQISAARYKQWKRWKKKVGDTNYMMAD